MRQHKLLVMSSLTLIAIASVVFVGITSYKQTQKENEKRKTERPMVRESENK